MLLILPQLCAFCFVAISDLAKKYGHMLSPDENAPYDEMIEINLSEVSSFDDLCLSFIRTH